MTRSPVTTAAPALWDCPRCLIGDMEPAEGETVWLGPFETVCNRCSFTMTQMLDDRQEVTALRIPASVPTRVSGVEVRD